MKTINATSHFILLAACLMVKAPSSQAAEGKALFEKNCAICHSKDGTGQTPMGIALKSRNFTDVAWQDKVKDEEIIKTINEGRLDPATGKERMKPFAKLLSADDIKSLAAHVRSFKGGATPAGTPRVLDIGPLAKEPGATPLTAAAAPPATAPVVAPAVAPTSGGGPLDMISHAYVLASLGSSVEQQNALATLASQETPAVDLIILQAMDKLLAGQVRPELQLDLLELARRRNAPIIKEKIQKYEASRSTGDSKSFYADVLSGGNAEAGYNVFFNKPESGCVACHAINGKGGAVGPNLSGIGARKSREYLLESLVEPDKEIAEGFLNVNVTLKDGKSFSGQVKRETATEQFLFNMEDGDVTVVKANIVKQERATSPMPPDLARSLPRRDLRDLLEFLCSLKVAPPTNAPLPPPLLTVESQAAPGSQGAPSASSLTSARPPTVTNPQSAKPRPATNYE